MTKYDLSLRDYWRIIKKRKLIIIFTFLAMTLFSFISATLTKPIPIYKTNATLKFEQAQTVYQQGHGYGTSTGSLDTQAAMIKSYFIMELVAKKMGLIPADVTPEEVRNSPLFINIILDLKSKVDTEQDGMANMINVITTSNDPQFAQRFANVIAQAYKEQHTLDINKKAIESRKFIESQRAVLRDKLISAEEAIKRFKEKNQRFTADATGGNMIGQVERLIQLYDQQKSIALRARAIQRLLEDAENRPMTSDKIHYYEGMSRGYRDLTEYLVQLLLQRDMLLLSYTENFPKVIELKNQIRETVISMRSQLSAHERALNEDMQDLRRQILEKEKFMRLVPEIGLELVRLERDRGIALEVYTLMEKKYQEALIAESEKVEEVQIVKPALEPRVPINPVNTGTNVMLGMIMGLVLGIVFAFLIETFDTSIGAIEEIEAFLETRVLGLIPFLNMEDIRDVISKGMTTAVSDSVIKRHFQLISHFLPGSTLAENYRALRTNFNFLTREREFKTVVITSTYPGEGKTSVASNLAITLAQSGHKVLLIDGDFRRPVIARVFGIDQIPGFTDVILGNYEWRSVIRSISDLMMGKMSVDDVTHTPGLDNLYLMTSGSMVPNPAELISSKTVTEIIRQVRDSYDMVLIDAPPILAATDATVWSSKTDGVMMVYQVGRIARGALKRAKAQIDNVKAQMLGIVLNGLKAEISPDFTSQDKYNYYYGGYGKTRKHRTITERVLSILPDNVAERVKRIVDRIRFRAIKDDKKPPRVITYKTGEGTFRWLKILILIIAVLFLAAGIWYQLGLRLPIP